MSHSWPSAQKLHGVCRLVQHRLLCCGTLTVSVGARSCCVEAKCVACLLIVQTVLSSGCKMRPRADTQTERSSSTSPAYQRHPRRNVKSASSQSSFQPHTALQCVSVQCVCDMGPRSSLFANDFGVKGTSLSTVDSSIKMFLSENKQNRW